MIRGPSPSPLLAGPLVPIVSGIWGKIWRHGGPGAGSRSRAPDRRGDRHACGRKIVHWPGLHRLFIGAEGCFGIVTRATLRLFPLPQARLLQAWEFADFATGFTAINTLLQAGLRPGLLEYSDESPAVDYTPPATLIVSFEGPRRVAQAEAEEAVHLCTTHQAGSFLCAMLRRSGHSVTIPAMPTLQRGPPDTPGIAIRDAIRWITCTWLSPPSAVLDYRRQSLEILAQQRLHALQTGLWCHAGLFNIAFAGADATTFTAYRWSCSSSVRICMAPWNTVTVWACVWHH